MVIVTYVLVGLYALLTGVAGFQQLKEKGAQIRALLFVIVSISLLITIFLLDKDLVFVLLIAEFLVLHLLTIFEGVLTNGKLNYSHHIIRLIFHCLLLVLVYNFLG